MEVAEKKRLNVMEMKCLRSVCGVTRMNRVRNEVRRRTGVTKELGGRAEQCVEVTWTHLENGRGPVGEKNSRIRCEMSEIEMKDTNGMDEWCENNAERKRNFCGARKDDCA